MEIKKLLYSQRDVWCNTYVLGEEGGPCIIIDPGFNENGFISRYVDRHHSRIEAIFLTHGHYDHIAGLSSLSFYCPVYMHQNDYEFLMNPRKNCSNLLVGEQKMISVPNVIFVNEQDEIEILKYKIKIIETPFHTDGSICLYLENQNALFSGDTLFHLGIGRTDLPGGHEQYILDSLKKLAALPHTTKVYPGHGEMTNIDNEMRYNPYMRYFGV